MAEGGRLPQQATAFDVGGEASIAISDSTINVSTTNQKTDASQTFDFKTGAKAQNLYQGVHTLNIHNYAASEFATTTLRPEAKGGRTDQPMPGRVKETLGQKDKSAVWGGEFGQLDPYHAGSPAEKAGRQSKFGVLPISDVLSLAENEPISSSSRIFHAILHSYVTGDRKVVAKITPADKKHQREANIHFSVPHHKNIVERIITNIFNFRGQPSIYIAMEHCDCDLHDHIKSQVKEKVPFDPKKYLSICRQIVVGLSFLHSNSVVHGDLKPGNVLLILDKNVVKLCDFGLSRTVSGDKTTTEVSSTQGGTAGWQAPEVLEGTTKVGFKSDIFPLGLVTFYSLSYGKHPYGDKSVSWNHYIVNGENRNLEGMLIPDADSAKFLLESMLEQNPADRPTAEDILKHLLFAAEASACSEPLLAASPRVSPTQRANPSSLRTLPPPPGKSLNRLRPAMTQPSNYAKPPPPLTTTPETNKAITHRNEPIEVEANSDDVTIPANKVTVLGGHEGVVCRCSWNPTCDLLASGSRDSTARIWDLMADAGTGASPSELLLRHEVKKKVFPFMAKEVDGSVQELDWNHDGTLLVTGSDDGSVRIWTKDGHLLHHLSQHSRGIYALKWNKQGNYIVSGSEDKTAIVWDAESGKLKQRFCFHKDDIRDVDWQDNYCFASCSDDANIHVCRLGCKKPVKSFKGHYERVCAVEWDPTKRFLASCSDDNTVKIWSMKHDGCVHDLRGHVSGVDKVRWSPAGPGSQNPSQKLLLASASYGKTVRLWDPERGVCLHTLEGHHGAVSPIAFSPDGRLLASGSQDKYVKIWNTQSGQLVRSYEGTSGIWDVCWNAAGTKVGACGGRTVTVLDLRK